MYNIDFRNFIFSLLPIALRGTMAELCYVFIHPIRFVYSQFRLYISSTNSTPWILQYDSTIEGLENMLNDYFNTYVNRPINITDVQPDNSLNIYPKAEQRPQLTTLIVSSRLTWHAEPFTVSVPIEYQNYEDRIIKLLNACKLYGLKYTITYYH